MKSVWTTYKDKFLASEGRIIDTDNLKVSHSEGQGYGMLLAEAERDRATFEQLWQWTVRNLARPNDHLFGWRWTPSNDGGSVHDWNNATDGDLLIAWALSRAGQRWRNQEWLDAAKRIANDVRDKLIRESNYGLLLLPGEIGFEKPEGCIVNLSYWIFPAFRALSKIDDSGVWDCLEATGLRLVTEARFGSWMLPPDWLLVEGGKLGLAPGRPHYGYDAVRVPLYLAWAGIEDNATYESFRHYARTNNGEPPAQVSLETGELEKNPAPPGVLAIYHLIAGTGDPNLKAPPALYQKIGPAERYYSASLGLLSDLAAREGTEQIRKRRPTSGPRSLPKAHPETDQRQGSPRSRRI
jgi:endo-1,4-beta-D-glucanase Y